MNDDAAAKGGTKSVVNIVAGGPLFEASKLQEYNEDWVVLADHKGRSSGANSHKSKDTKAVVVASVGEDIRARAPSENLHSQSVMD